MSKNIRFILGLLTCSIILLTSNLSAYERVNTNSLRLPAQEPSVSYRLVEALPELRFEKPVAIATEPGQTNRLYVIERVGRIIVITNLAAPTKTVFLDITNKVVSNWNEYVEGLASMAFHPGYSSNGYFFVTYTLRTTTSQGTGNHNRVSRFERATNDLFHSDPASELPLITQRDEGDGHNLNDLHFGPDGYLYIAGGDEGDGGRGDDYNNAQRIDRDFFSAVLRIDVDNRAGNLNPNSHPAVDGGYKIPADNPYVGVTNFAGVTVDPAQVRTEFWAVGFRNPWRMSFDPVTGHLYLGDVGQHGREEINLVVKGGNYGWAWWEGNLPGPKSPAPAGVSLLQPIAQYTTGYETNRGFAVMGGVVYRGAKISQLAGAYVFSDFVSGHLWAIRYDGTNTTPMEWLATKRGLAGFGYDPRDREIIAVDETEGRIWKLDYSDAPGVLPAKLSEVGVFANLSDFTPAPGIYPYDINVPFWSDHAEKSRWFSLPGTTNRIKFSADGNWEFPAGTFWVKHFDLQLTNGVPESGRRIETRVLVKTSNNIYGVTYKWDNDQQNATLVSPHGEEAHFTIHEGGSTRAQKWTFPSRADCLQCHTTAGGFAAGFNTWQLNRPAPGTTNNLLQLLAQHSYFSTNIPDPFLLRKGAPASDLSSSREFRVRSYLAANCASCHQPDGIGRGIWDARLSTPLSSAGIIDGELITDFGDSQNRVVVPGNLDKSVLYQRIANFGQFHMPPLATSVLNEEAIYLVGDWIAQDLQNYKTFPQWQFAHFSNTNTSNSLPDSDPDLDGYTNFAEYLLGTDPNQVADRWQFGIKAEGANVILEYIHLANRGIDLQWRANLSGADWSSLLHEANAPSFPPTNSPRQILIPVSGSNAFFRARIFEP